ncbi:response regulator [Sphingomonas sp. CFBP 13733]|jgi:CheY-like chemotaxis protein|uniref:response regulator n=1 Tax=Sphingomonas sp. CFBP 13733 TaxID=2775291 RepID=UPI00177E12B0|nr:response regulator [Sphingomonas sp. CFBP 13733]MBD8640547.1 response regulator [Sphingomonas sp. CFBP 13733]
MGFPLFAPPLIRRPAAGIVLIVEDHLLVQITATARIEDAGMSTLVADDADEAMAILTSRDDVAAVFTDIDMPGSMDGLALAAIIRRRWPRIQVVVTSGQRPSKAAGLPDGVAFFQKPYDYSNLVNHFR